MQQSHFPTPTVTDVAPSSGPSVGGTTVTPTGTGIVRTTELAIGGQRVSSCTVDSPARIRFADPSDPPGPVTVVVTTPGGTAPAPGGFGYVTTSQGTGDWLDGADSGAFAFGDAHVHGSAGGVHMTEPVVGMAATP